MIPALKYSGCTVKCQAVALPSCALGRLNHRPVDHLTFLKVLGYSSPLVENCKEHKVTAVSCFSLAACSYSAHPLDFFSARLCQQGVKVGPHFLDAIMLQYSSTAKVAGAESRVQTGVKQGEDGRGEQFFPMLLYSCPFQALPVRKENRAASPSPVCVEPKSPLECHKKDGVVVTNTVLMFEAWWAEISIAVTFIREWQGICILKNARTTSLHCNIHHTRATQNLAQTLLVFFLSFLLFPEQKVHLKFLLSVSHSLSLSPLCFALKF